VGPIAGLDAVKKIHDESLLVVIRLTENTRTQRAHLSELASLLWPDIAVSFGSKFRH
jgi:hypothetical protein